jgi:hypothetical protein
MTPGKTCRCRFPKVLRRTVQPAFISFSNCRSTVKTFHDDLNRAQGIKLKHWRRRNVCGDLSSRSCNFSTNSRNAVDFSAPEGCGFVVRFSQGVAPV